MAPHVLDGTPSGATQLSESKFLPLFRLEAISSHTPQSFGSVYLVPPPKVGSVLRLFLLLFAVCICLAFFGSYTSRQHATGILLPRAGLIKVSCLQSGLVQASVLREGAFVHKGDVLVSISLDRSSTTIVSLQLASSDQLLRERNSLALDGRNRFSQISQKNRAFSERAELLNKELDDLNEELALRQKQVALADQTRERYLQLYTAALISKQAYEEEQLRVTVESGTAELTTKRAIEQLQGELLDLHQQNQTLNFEYVLSRASTERELDRLNTDVAHQRTDASSTVRAPIDGNLAGISVRLGDTVNTGTVIATIIPPDDGLEAHVYVSDFVAQHVHIGDAVKMTFSGFPVERYGAKTGRVVRISGVSLTPAQILDQSGLGVSGPLYDLTVTLPNTNVAAQKLHFTPQAGTRIDASVLGETRHWYMWFFYDRKELAESAG
jgi:membrane fusion protein